MFHASIVDRVLKVKQGRGQIKRMPSDFPPALLVTDEQHEVIRSQRRLEIQQRQELFQWGEDPLNHGLPGYVKSEHWKKLPKDVQFTEEAVDDLHTARNKALVNLGLIKLLNIFDSWEDFDDYRKVCICLISLYPLGLMRELLKFCQVCVWVVKACSMCVSYVFIERLDNTKEISQQAAGLSLHSVFNKHFR